MKRIISIVILLLLVVISTSHAQITITVGSITVNPTDTSVTIPINVTNFNNLGAISIYINYTKSVLTWRGATNWAISPSASPMANAKEGTAAIGAFSISPINVGTGKLVDLVFRYNGGSTDLNFDISTCDISDTLPAQIKNITYVNGFVRPPQTGYKLSGSVTYFNTANSRLSNVKVYLKNATATLDSVLTDTAGVYTFNNVKNGTYTLDGSCQKAWDGVTSNDALIIRKYSIDAYTFTDIQLKAANVNGLGDANATDALIVRRRIADQISFFPIPDWVFETPTVIINGANLVQNIKGLCAGDVNGSSTPEAK